MRKPKHKQLRPMSRYTSGGSSDHDFTAHAPNESFVRVSVSECEGLTHASFPEGTLIVDLERAEGDVVVRWTDRDGRTQSITLSRKGGRDGDL